MKMKYFNNRYQGSIKLDLGCGPWKKDGFIGIDNYLGEEQWKSVGGKPIDINHDLSTGIPFADSTVDEVFAAHFLEHTDIDFMLNEVNRVCKKDARVVLIVPYANSAEGMFPGHQVFLTEKFFLQNTLFNNLFYKTKFEYTPSDEWENGEIKKYIKAPFDIARIHYFNICKWFTITCMAKKR